MLDLINTTVIDSFALYGAIIYSQENYNGYVKIKNCSFVSNNGAHSLIDLSTNIGFTIEETFISNSSNNLFLVSDSNLSLVNVSIKDHICLGKMQGCILKSEHYSTINISFCIVSNVSSLFEDDLIFSEKSSLFFSYFVFRKMFIQKNRGACGTIIESQLMVNHSEFSEYNFNCLYFFQSSIFINDSIFNNSKKISLLKYNIFGTIYSHNSPYLNILNSKFINNFNILNGSALYLKVDDFVNCNESQIINSLFLSNIALDNGAIFLYNVNISLNGNIFDNNYGKRGAAIYCFNSEKNIMKITISENIFKNNFAEIEGGAIKWNDEKPFLLNNTFLNNYAIYGKDVASFPIRMMIKSYLSGEENKIFLPQTDEILWPFENNNIIFNNISTGNSIPYIFQIIYLDTYGKIYNLIDGFAKKNFMISFF